jgi:hypothetical protein
MQYLLLIYGAEKAWTTMSEAERNTLFAEYRTFTDDIKKSGHYVGGNALQPIHTATTVRVREGKSATTDGPFAETREQLGGYMLIDVKDLDEAIAIAGRIPLARTSTVEIRPVREGQPS